jgi:hypothetical protein
MARFQSGDRTTEVAERSHPEGSLPDGYLDLYKLAVEMADRVSARRTAANSFFLAVQTALVTLLGVDGLSRKAVAGAGLLLAGAWWLLLRSYRKLNGAKFQVITEMETQLPVAVFKEEWTALKRAGPAAKRTLRDRYAELGVLEQVVPAIFAVIYIVVLITAA